MIDKEKQMTGEGKRMTYIEKPDDRRKKAAARLVRRGWKRCAGAKRELTQSVREDSEFTAEFLYQRLNDSGEKPMYAEFVKTQSC